MRWSATRRDPRTPWPKGRAAAKEWTAAAMNQGAKLAHRWTAKIGAKPQLAEKVINGASHSFTQLHMMASRFNTWVAKWQKTHESAQYVVTTMQKVRTCAKATQTLPKITPKDLDDALDTMNEAVGMGTDRSGPRFIKSLLQNRRQKIRHVLNIVRKKLLGPGRYSLHGCAFSPRRSKGSDPSPS